MPTANTEPSPGNVDGDFLLRLAVDPATARSVEWRAIIQVARPLAADLLATFVFYVVFAVSGSVTLSTILAMLLGVGQLGWMLATGRGAPPIQCASLVLVIVVGLLAIVTHDPRYMLYKASLIYVAIGITMFRRGWLARYVPPVVTAYLPSRVIALFGYLWAILILGTGVMSFILIRTQPVRTVALVMVAWGPASKVALLFGQYLAGRAIIRRAVVLAVEQKRALIGG